MEQFKLIRIGQSHPQMTSDGFIALMKLRKAVLKLHRLCERYCNERDFDYSLIDKQDAKVRYLIKELPVSLNIDLEEIQHDPRGWAVRLKGDYITELINERKR